jgi:hypothetical protein
MKNDTIEYLEKLPTARLVAEFENTVCAHLALNSVISGNTAIATVIDPQVRKVMFEERDRLWRRRCILETVLRESKK